MGALYPRHAFYSMSNPAVDRRYRKKRVARRFDVRCGMAGLGLVFLREYDRSNRRKRVIGHRAEFVSGISHRLKATKILLSSF